MLGILNRVTDQSIQILLEQAVELPITEPQHLEEVLTLLLNKVTNKIIVYLINFYKLEYSNLLHNSNIRLLSLFIISSLQHL